MLGTILVEVCDMNSVAWLPVSELEETYSGLSVLITSCLGHCELCARNPYAYVNGRMVVENDREALYRKLIEVIEEELANA